MSTLSFRSLAPRSLLAAARVAAPLALALCAACASAEQSSRVRELMNAGEYERAAIEAAAWRERAPRSAEAEHAHQMASAALLLERGRRATFEGELDAALAHFEQAEQVAPEDAVVQDWVEKTHANLAERWLDRASELYASNELEAALEAYERVLVHAPQNERARDGCARILLALNHRAGLGETYYKEGVRALREYWLVQARTQFDYTAKYVPEDERVEDRRAQVRALLAEDRLQMAFELERQNRYHAARNEFRLAQLLDARRAEAAAGLDRMAREVESFELLQEAERLERKGSFDEALALLARAAEQTSAQSAAVEALRSQVEEARVEREYQAALDLERDFRFEEAAEAFGKLLAAHGYFKDSQERQATLVSYVGQAAELYEQAARSSDPAEQRELLRRIEVFWPDYRDTRARLAAFEGL
jgi:tetratricopeptide (TPR) repeat protein